MTSLLLLLATATGGVSTPSAGAFPTVHAAITLHLRGPADRTFPLFDPVNESRWAPDWRPALLGDARVDEGLVFTTDDEHGRSTWLLDRYDRARRTLRYVTFRTATLTTIDIAVVADGSTSSIATVAYSRTALDARSIDAVRAFERDFPQQAPHWENAINAALARDAGGQEAQHR